MKRGKNMKSEAALDIVKNLGNEIPKAERAVFSALVDDTKKMEKRMSALEKTVSEVKADVRDVKKNVSTIQSDIKELSKQINSVINEKQSLWKFLGMLIKENRFWGWLIILTLLIFGVAETDLFKMFK